MILEAGIAAGATLVSGLVGAAKSDKIETAARAEMAEAMNMRMNSSEKKRQMEKKAQEALKKYYIRRGATIANLLGFEDTMNQIVNIGFAIEDNTLCEIRTLTEKDIASYHTYSQPHVPPTSDLQCLVQMINPFTGGIGGMMVRDSKAMKQRAEYEWDVARAKENANLATVELYQQIVFLVDAQKEILTKLNSFFNKAHQYAREMIRRKGTKLENYTKDDREKILLLMKCAKCMNAFINVQMMNEEYTITEQGKKIMDITGNFLNENVF